MNGLAISPRGHSVQWEARANEDRNVGNPTGPPISNSTLYDTGQTGRTRMAVVCEFALRIRILVLFIFAREPPQTFKG
jgi:hypothetical protein